MSAEIAPGLLIHYGLKERSENSGRNPAPVQRAAVEQLLSHGGIESGGGQHFFKEQVLN